MPNVTAVMGGNVVLPDGVRAADILIDGARITTVLRPGSASSPPSAGVIDAGGCVVLPGGVDPHTHPLANLGSATAAALAGGTTTIGAFTDERPGEGPVDAFRRAKADELPQARIDVFLHPLIRDPDHLTRHDLEELGKLGARSVKLFLAYPELGLMTLDRVLFETLRSAAELGLIVMVHCENGGVVAALEAEQLAVGGRGPKGFVATRPGAVEEEAVARTLALARLAGAPVYLVHLTTEGSLDLVREARARGQPRIVAEVCTHHLLFDSDRYDGPEPWRYLTVPPLRSRADVEALWNGVVDGTVDAIGSDHAEVSFQPDVPPGDFRSIPYSFAGVGARLSVVLAEGMRRGIPVERLSHLLTGGPAEAFRINAAGVTAGASADLVVWDPTEEWVIGEHDLDDEHATPYHGLRLRGRIRAVVGSGATEAGGGVG